MSEIDLAEAIEVGTQALARELGSKVADSHARPDATAVLTAAAPLIERQVREQIARDIEAAEQQMKASTIDRPKVGPGEFLNDWQWAARIARDGAP